MSEYRSPGSVGPLSPNDSARIHATYRLLARALQASEVVGRDRRRWQSGALAASILCDVLSWLGIRGGTRSLPARVAVDLADLALWAGPCRSGWTAALTAQVPVDVESGIAYGARGFGFPLAAGAVSSLTRAIFGQKPDPIQHVPHAGAVIGGITVRHGEQVRMAQAHEEHEVELSAKGVRAFLAGQNSVAMGASSIIDQLKPVAVILGSDTPGSALNQVRAGWKDSLAEQAQQYAVFLDSAVRLWLHAHNDHPDLRGFVDVVDITEGDGTVLVTGYQARRIAESLEAQGLHGHVNIEVSGRREARVARPGRSFDLLVNGEVVSVPSDPSVSIRRFNPAPPTYFFGAWAALMPTRESDGDLPLHLALVCSAAYLSAGLRFFGKPPEDTVGQALWTGVGLSALQGIICARGCKVRRNTSGGHLFHGTFGIAPAGLLLAASRPVLSKGQQAGGFLLLSLVAAGAYLAAERPRGLVDFAFSLAHPTAAMIGMATVAQAAARATEQTAAAMRAQDEVVEAAAFERGRLRVLQLADSALKEAEAAFARHRDLDPIARSNVLSRLEAIRTAAAQLEV
jgi:hypothetical protein